MVQAMAAKSTASISRAWGLGKRGWGKVRGAMADGAVVVTITVKLLPGTTKFGETTQVESKGTPAQIRATDWLNSPLPSTVKVYIADCPGETVADNEEPDTGASVKSSHVPLRLTVCVLPVMLRLLSVMVKVPVRVGGVGGSITNWGVKVTLMVHEAPAATLTPQLLVWLKSPLVLMLVTLSATFPVLLRVTGCAALVVPSN
jgi:hypothetical protein